MSGVLLGGMGLSALFWAVGSDTNPMFNVEPWWHLVLGGYAFGLVFMATDPVSAAMTSRSEAAFSSISRPPATPPTSAALASDFDHPMLHRARNEPARRCIVVRRSQLH